jgi:amino acid adenylation domain-containing protein
MSAPTEKRSPFNVISRLRGSTLERQGKRAFTFLGPAADEVAHLTYGELDLQARAIAASLQASGAAGQRALLLYPPGFEFVAAFLGCLYGGVAAVPAYPPRSSRTLPRLLALAEDAQPAVALTTCELLPQLQAIASQLPRLAAIRWLTTDRTDLSLAAAWRDPEPDAGSLAFLQYTSGSTASPRGVMVSHGNLLRNEAMIAAAFGQSEASVIVGWLPLYHDMGLIGNVLQPLYLGATCILMSPADFLQQPLRWLEAISRYRATTSGGPNFAYDLCVRKIGEGQRAALDLSCWEVAFNGAEPVRQDTIERFARAFAPCGFRREAFYPCYGLAEATLFVAGGGKGRPPVLETVESPALEAHRVVPAARGGPSSRTLVGCGRTWMGHEVAIVDPESRTRLSSGRVGEIWVAGPSVTAGYWRRPEATEQLFRARLADTRAGPFLRTGDFGFLHGDELFVTGRLKDLIILRGRNLYPQDVELTAERSHPALRPGCGAAFSIDSEGEERLVVVQELDRHREPEAEVAAGAVRRAVAEEHEAQVHEVVLLRAGTVPKTSSGKIQRHACRAAYLAGSLEAVLRSALDEPSPRAAATPAPAHRGLLDLAPEARRAALLSYLQDQAGRALRVNAGGLPPDRPLTESGLDSLAAMELQHEIEAGLGISLSLTALLDGASLAGLAAELQSRLEAAAAAAEGTAAPALTAEPLPGVFPLSAGQRALWTLDRLAPGNEAYILAGAGRIRGAVVVAALAPAFRALVERHPALRVVVTPGADGPHQRVQEPASIPFREENGAAWSEARLAARLLEEAYRPFDLERGPLLRVALFRRGPHASILLLTAHHLVADFWSIDVLLRELAVLAAGGSLAPLPASYADFVRWQRQLLAGPRGQSLWAYWRDQLAGSPLALSLPTDRSRPRVQTFAGAARARRLEAELSGRIHALGRLHGATLFTTLLAAFAALLHRTTGQDDLLIGSPVAGRGPACLAGLVGYFVNPVVIRSTLPEDAGFDALLAQTRRTTLAALAHQDFPFPALAERLEPEHDPSRSPVFQVMFVLQQAAPPGEALAGFALGEEGATLRLGGLAIESVPLPRRGAQFDLTLAMAEWNGALSASCQFNTDLFDASTIDRMLGHLATLLAGAAADPAAPLAALPLLTAPERWQLLSEWNADPFADEPTCIHHLVEAQAERTPESVAVAAGETSLTYRELDRRAKRLAERLRELGVGPEVRVGVCTERSAAMVIGLLATLKAGGAYVPLDPAYPPERLAFMAEDSGLEVLLTQDSLSARLPQQVAPAARRVSLDALPPGRPRDGPFASGVDPGNLAYLIYTSGSTGRPKGVAIEHHSAAALLRWAGRAFAPPELAGVLASTSICFDLSIFEIFAPLCHGGRVILAENALALPTLSAAAAVSLINTVPSALAELLRRGGLPAGLRTVNLAGEPLARSLADEIERRTGAERVLNLYGPSEDTTYSTWAVVARGDPRPPSIGRPLAGTQLYLLDRRLQPVPLGAVGEICLAGAGLARGYLDRPDLTAERFVPDPFGRRPGGRLYRTGDLGRFRPDGEVEFLGRLDNQVKIHGFRIELGEIEAVLSTHPGVRQAAAAVLEGATTGDRRLVAYVVPVTNGHGPAPEELREFLRRKLPVPLIPSALILLPALPTTASGKIDRRALPPPAASPARPADSFVPPGTAVEQLLTDIWREVLHLPRIGIYDDFFDLGGHSFQAAQVLSRVEQAFRAKLPLRALLDAPTVAGLAVAIAEELMRRADGETAARALAAMGGGGERQAP